MSESPTKSPDYLTLAEAAKLTPGRPRSATIWRWARRGLKVRGRNEHIRLEHARIGGRIYTTSDWLHEFFHKVAQEDLAGCAVGESAAAVCLSHGDAELALRAEGLQMPVVVLKPGEKALYVPATKRWGVLFRAGHDEMWEEQEETVEAQLAWIDGSGALCFGDLDASGAHSLVRSIAAGLWMQLWLIRGEQEEGEAGGAEPPPPAAQT